ncbi:MAG: ribosome small subunit-dependent GTPase A [Bacteroidetes bacterium]|nr:ribosome small subunit-dependent GTPase A [Bacteroidota bacterium]
MNNLKTLGWNSFFENQFEEFRNSGFIPGRIAIENKNNYSVLIENGEVTAEISGKLMFSSESNSDLPKTGDWVILSVFENDNYGIIHNVLKRQSKVSRKKTGKAYDEQVLITNVDFIFIVQSLDNNYNINRLERYLTTVYQSGATPIVILSKADLCNDVELKIAEIQKSHSDVKIIAVSSFENIGIEEINNNLNSGTTYAFLGSSGVGKSTIINKLVGEEIQKTTEVRTGDNKGKHTTTKRELIILEDKGILIDTPGMRGLELWSANEGINTNFAEFEEFEGNCRFADCTHTHETGCAVIEAVKNNLIEQSRYDNYLKLRKELRYLETRVNHKVFLEEKKKWKEIQKWYRNNFKDKKRTLKK